MFKEVLLRVKKQHLKYTYQKIRGNISNGLWFVYLMIRFVQYIESANQGVSKEC